MDMIFHLSFDGIAVSFLVCAVLREAMILGLPDDIAGPGGWFIDTGEEA